ncbi:hypothetical protein [Microbacterium sp. XT11]|uniref:hypothetical protein n=1 Tax=Microbacterium sp. XT11 TaxID=367477 RepID=UPI00082FB603|nr:hypothetical protein [Microbacterium sp. XT11]
MGHLVTHRVRFLRTGLFCDGTVGCRRFVNAPLAARGQVLCGAFLDPVCVGELLVLSVENVQAPLDVRGQGTFQKRCARFDRKRLLKLKRDAVAAKRPRKGRRTKNTVTLAVEIIIEIDARKERPHTAGCHRMG